MAHKPIRAKDRLVRALREAISAGHLPRGQRLTELALVEALGISRTPVREALQTLHMLGLLTRHESGRGFEVKGYTLEEASDIYYVRSVLEEAAVKRAIPRMTDADVARLQQVLDQERDDLEQGRSRTVRTTLYDLHSLIVELSGSAQLQRSFANLLDQIGMIITTREPDSEAMWASHREHAAIVRAIADRDVALAQRLVRLHLENTVEYLRADPSRLEPRPEPLEQVLEQLRADLTR